CGGHSDMLCGIRVILLPPKARVIKVPSTAAISGWDRLKVGLFGPSSALPRSRAAALATQDIKVSLYGRTLRQMLPLLQHNYDRLTTAQWPIWPICCFWVTVRRTARV